MKFRIIKTEISNKEAFVPQYKPCLLLQALQLNFDWRMFYNKPIKESDRRVVFFRQLENAVKFIESGVHRDTLASQVVWQDGRAVNHDNS